MTVPQIQRLVESQVGQTGHLVGVNEPESGSEDNGGETDASGDEEFEQEQSSEEEEEEEEGVDAAGDVDMVSDMSAVAGNGRDTEVCQMITLSDPDVLDCPICLDPLTVPVFQCENGHITCSTCTTKVRNKCPSCQRPIIASNRCRAIEKVVESVKISCRHFKYGCIEKISYCNKKEHESTCAHAPCSCPQLNCTFISSLKQLSAHFTSAHPNIAKPFQFGTVLRITLEANQKNIIFQEKGGHLFILNNAEFQSHGRVITVGCIQPSTSKEEFRYYVAVKKCKCTLILYDIADNVAWRAENPDQKRFLMVPRDFVDSFGRLNVEVKIFIAQDPT